MNLKEVKEGEIYKIKTNSCNLEGRVISYKDKILLLKLSSGYNIGINFRDIKAIKKLNSKRINIKRIKLKTNKKKLPKISMITTGGTITSRIDYRTGAVYPLEKPEELLVNIPELSDKVNIKNLIQPFSILSEDMSIAHWKVLGKYVCKELNSDSKGVIVTHGTDTLHYTAAALSFMLESLSKPVALVGGQRSSDRGSFDGALNMLCAASYCTSDIAEVAIVMHGSEEDTFCIASRGTNVRKMSSSRRDTFRPINELPLAKIDSSGKIEKLNKSFDKRSNKKTKLNDSFEKKVALIKMYPGADPRIIDYYLNEKYKGIIIEGTGFGHVSTMSNNNWIPYIKKATKKGVFIGITSQAFYGKTNPYIYSAGRLMLDVGAVFLKEMLPETAYVKLSWAFGQTKNLDKVKEIMLTSISSEIGKKIPINSFLY